MFLGSHACRDVERYAGSKTRSEMFLSQFLLAFYPVFAAQRFALPRPLPFQQPPPNRFQVFLCLVALPLVSLLGSVSCASFDRFLLPALRSPARSDLPRLM